MKKPVAALALCAIFLSAPAIASDDALESFKRAQAAFEAGEYETALEEARRAYELSASPNAHLYLSRSLVKLGRFDEAYREMSATLVEASGAATADKKYVPTRDAAAAELAMLNDKVAKIILAFVKPTPNAKIMLNGAEFPGEYLGKPFPVLPGDTVVRVNAPGKLALERSLLLDGGQTETLVLQLEDAPAKTPSGAPPATRETKTAPNTWAYVSMGVGAVGVGTFAVMGLSAKSAHDTLQDECGARCSDARYQDDIDRGKRAQTLANIGLAVGIVGLSVGGALLLFGSETTRDSAALSVTAGPGSGYLRYQSAF